MSLMNYGKEKQEADAATKVIEPSTDKRPALKAGDNSEGKYWPGPGVKFVWHQ